MRRPVKNRIEVEGDIKYGSVIISSFINKMMKDGKKSVASKIVYDALSIIEKKAGKPALEVLDQALQNAGPTMELKSRRVGGANYQVPIEVKPERRISLAMKWIVESARSGKGKPAREKLAEELLNAFNNTGGAVKKKNDTHRMAEANKAFAHFAW
jgi:small subunit ribosomal protein S7